MENIRLRRALSNQREEQKKDGTSEFIRNKSEGKKKYDT